MHILKTSEFCAHHGACKDGEKWAISVSSDMADVWDRLIADSRHSWLTWTATRHGMFDHRTMRLLACRYIRETPAGDGRTIWDLLPDQQSREAVGVAERYADGKATINELNAACKAAVTTSDEAYLHDAFDASRAAYNAAVTCARYDLSVHPCVLLPSCITVESAYSDAKRAQVRMIADLGNPFRR